jgi:hypothetical protein
VLVKGEIVMGKTEKKICTICHKEQSVGNFYNVNSRLFLDKKTPYCKSCIREQINEGDINSLLNVLREIDRPYIEQIWDKATESKNNTVGEYFKMLNSLAQYRDLTWNQGDKQDVGQVSLEVVHNNQSDEQPINSIQTENGIIEIDGEIKSRWMGYSPEEMLKMEAFYQSMIRSYDISTPTHKQQLKLMCMLNLKMNTALENDDFKAFQAYHSQYEKILQSSGFRPIDRKSSDEATGIRSFSQVFEEVEKNGFIEPYPYQEKQDIIDMTIMYMSNYTRKLLNMQGLSEPQKDTPKVDEGADE